MFPTIIQIILTNSLYIGIALCVLYLIRLVKLRRANKTSIILQVLACTAIALSFIIYSCINIYNCITFREFTTLQNLKSVDFYAIKSGAVQNQLYSITNIDAISGFIDDLSEASLTTSVRYAKGNGWQVVLRNKQGDAAYLYIYLHNNEYRVYPSFDSSFGMGEYKCVSLGKYMK